MESAEIISPPTAFARLIDNDVFPTAVGPVKTIKSFIKSAPNRITQPESENEVFNTLYSQFAVSSIIPLILVIANREFLCYTFNTLIIIRKAGV